MGVNAATDETLVERVAAGSQEALAELYDRYQALSYGMATRITGDRTIAQDVVQETFLGIWRAAQRFTESRGSARTWIIAICHHRAVDVVRRRRPDSPLPDPELPPPEQLTTPDVWPEVNRSLDAGVVRRAIDELPGPQREAIELAYFGGLTQQEIARRTDVPLGTVKSRVRLGLVALRDALGDATADGPSGAGQIARESHDAAQTP